MTKKYANAVSALQPPETAREMWAASDSHLAYAEWAQTEMSDAQKATLAIRFPRREPRPAPQTSPNQVHSAVLTPADHAQGPAPAVGSFDGGPGTQKGPSSGLQVNGTRMNRANGHKPRGLLLRIVRRFGGNRE